MWKIDAAQDYQRIIKPDVGTVEIGQTIKIGYFSQENEYMDESKRVIDYVKEAGEYIATSDGKITASRCWNDFFLTGQCSVEDRKVIRRRETETLSTTCFDGSTKCTDPG